MRLEKEQMMTEHDMRTYSSELHLCCQFLVLRCHDGNLTGLGMRNQVLVIFLIDHCF